MTATVGVSSASQTCHSPSRSRHLLWGGAPRSLSEGQRQPPPIPTPSSSWPDKEKLQRSWGLWSEGAGSRPCSPSCTGLRRPLCPSFRVPESPREAAPGSLQPAQSLTAPGWAAGRSLGKGTPPPAPPPQVLTHRLTRSPSPSRRQDVRTPRAWRGVAARSLPRRKEGAPRTPAHGLRRPSTVTISLQLPRLQARRTKQVAPRPLTWQPEKPDFSPGLSCWPDTDPLPGAAEGHEGPWGPWPVPPREAPSARGRGGEGGLLARGSSVCRAARRVHPPPGFARVRLRDSSRFS